MTLVNLVYTSNEMDIKYPLAFPPQMTLTAGQSISVNVYLNTFHYVKLTGVKLAKP